jgi:hypothetical protein
MNCFLGLITCLLIVINLNGQENVCRNPRAIESFQIPMLADKIKIASFYGEDSSFKQNRKIEFGLALPQAINQQISSFFNQIGERETQLNPYNRADIDIEVMFDKGTEHMHKGAGFFYEEYVKDKLRNIWVKDTTSFPFRIRFSTPFIGSHHAEIQIKIRSKVLHVFAFDFHVESGDVLGQLTQGKFGKHFKYEHTDQSFVGVGQVIPWSDMPSWGRPLDEPSRPKRFEVLYNSLTDLRRAGGNFTRFVAAPWFMELEWEALGNYEAKMAQAWEFDRVDEYCKELGIYYIFCMRLHSQLESREDARDMEMKGIRWETNCYNDRDQTPAEMAAEPPIGIEKVQDYFRNEQAIFYQQNYYRYMVARYGYSTNLAAWQLFSELDNVEGYKDLKTADSIVINTQNRAEITAWTQKMAKYMKDDLGDRHLLSISMASMKNYEKDLWDPLLWDMDEIDFLGVHDYVYEVEGVASRMRNRNSFYRFASINRLNIGIQEGKIRYPNYQNKMYIYDEFGQTNAIQIIWPDDKEVDPTALYNQHTGFMFKQDLWFTITAGTAVAGLDWWCHNHAERITDWYTYFNGVRLFFDSINFEATNYASVRKIKGEYYIAQPWPLSLDKIEKSTNHPYDKDDLLESYTMVSSDGKQAFGYLMNRSYNLGNLYRTDSVLYQMYMGQSPFAKKYIYPSMDDDEVEEPIDIPSDTYFMKLYGFGKRTLYQVDFYNTLTGEIYTSKQFKSTFRGVLKVYAPEMKVNLYSDLAYKIHEVNPKE